VDRLGRRERRERDFCAEHGIAFLFKQWGEWAPYNRGRDALLTDEPMQHFGKKLAGRLLDGIEHNGFPT
jgi:protein gp37